jgi:hypothetical protein
VDADVTSETPAQKVLFVCATRNGTLPTHWIGPSQASIVEIGLHPSLAYDERLPSQISPHPCVFKTLLFSSITDASLTHLMN